MNNDHLLRAIVESHKELSEVWESLSGLDCPRVSEVTVFNPKLDFKYNIKLNQEDIESQTVLKKDTVHVIHYKIDICKYVDQLVKQGLNFTIGKPDVTICVAVDQGGLTSYENDPNEEWHVVMVDFTASLHNSRKNGDEAYKDLFKKSLQTHYPEVHKPKSKPKLSVLASSIRAIRR